MAGLHAARRRLIATSMTLASLSKFMSQTGEAISKRGSTSPWRRTSSSSRANSLAQSSMRVPPRLALRRGTFVPACLQRHDRKVTAR